MVEKGSSVAAEFTDHAGLRTDAEIMAGLDKQRNGKKHTSITL